MENRLILNINDYIIYKKKSRGHTSISFISWKKFAKDWLGFDTVPYRSKGVYLFGGFYVGASLSLNERLFSHCWTALSNRHQNKKFEMVFNEHIKMGDAMLVEILDENTHVEYLYLKKYKDQIVNERV